MFLLNMNETRDLFPYEEMHVYTELLNIHGKRKSAAH